MSLSLIYLSEPSVFAVNLLILWSCWNLGRHLGRPPIGLWLRRWHPHHPLHFHRSLIKNRHVCKQSGKSRKHLIYSALEQNTGSELRIWFSLFFHFTECIKRKRALQTTQLELKSYVSLLETSRLKYYISKLTIRYLSGVLWYRG